MKKKIAAVLMLIIFAVSLTSCVRLDIDVKVKSNGKMDATMILAMAESMAGEAMGEVGFSDEDMEEYRKNGWKVEPYNQDGFVGYKMTQTDVSTKELLRTLSQGEAEGDGSGVLTKNGNTYILDLPIGGIMSGLEDDTIDMVSMLRSFGASMKFRITLPVKPVTHNAHTVSEDGKTLEWDIMSMKAGETAHVEFKAGGGFLRYALIMSAIVLAACLIGFLVLKKKKAAAPVPNAEQVSYTPEATPVYPEPQQTEWVPATAESVQAVPSDTDQTE